MSRVAALSLSSQCQSGFVIGRACSPGHRSDYSMVAAAGSDTQREPLMLSRKDNTVVLGEAFDGGQLRCKLFAGDFGVVVSLRVDPKHVAQP